MVEEKGETAPTNGRGPPRDSRFGGLAGAVENSMRLSIDKQLGSLTAPYPITAEDLSELSHERSRQGLATLLQKGIKDVDDDGLYWACAGSSVLKLKIY